MARQINKGKFPDFWNDITALAKFELRKMKNDRGEENIHSNVMSGVLANFEVSNFLNI